MDRGVNTVLLEKKLFVNLRDKFESRVKLDSSIYFDFRACSIWIAINQRIKIPPSGFRMHTFQKANPLLCQLGLHKRQCICPSTKSQLLPRLQLHRFIPLGHHTVNDYDVGYRAQVCFRNACLLLDICCWPTYFKALIALVENRWSFNLHKVCDWSFCTKCWSFKLFKLDRSCWENVDTAWVSLIAITKSSIKSVPVIRISRIIAVTSRCGAWPKPCNQCRITLWALAWANV